MMKNKTKKAKQIKTGWESLDGIPYEVFRCKKPIKMVIMNDTPRSELWKSYKLIIKSIFSMSTWLEKCQCNIWSNHLVNLEIFTKWLIDNKEKLSNDSEFRMDWMERELFVKRTLEVIEIIKNNTKIIDGYKIYEFPSLAHFGYFAYNACKVMGAGYEFRSLEKEFPISFETFKDVQYTSKVLYTFVTNIESKFSDLRKDEMNRWLDN